MVQIGIKTVQNFRLIWRDSGSGGEMDGAFYQPLPPAGYFPVGSYGQANYGTPSPQGAVISVKEVEVGSIAQPIDYQLIWADYGSGADMNGSFWMPLPPSGYKALGVVCQTGYNKPSLNAVRCVREDLLLEGEIYDRIWSDNETGADRDFSAWRITSKHDYAFICNTFMGVSSHSKPSSKKYFCINAKKTNIINLGDPFLQNHNFKERKTLITIDKGNFGLHFHSIFGERWQHLQDMIRLPNYKGKRYYMGTWSQNCNDHEGGMVFVAEVYSNNMGKVIWCDILSNTHLSGGVNHPGDLRRHGHTVVIAGQNWKGDQVAFKTGQKGASRIMTGAAAGAAAGTTIIPGVGTVLGGIIGGYAAHVTETPNHVPFADKMNIGKGGQNVLFYDVSDPTKPSYMGKMNSAWSNNRKVAINTDISSVCLSVSPSGQYFYLSFNGIKGSGLKCRSTSLSPYAKWELIEYGSDGSPSTVFLASISPMKARWALYEKDKKVVSYFDINYSPGENFLTNQTNKVTLNWLKDSNRIPSTSFGDGTTFSLNVLEGGMGYIIYANVESDGIIQIEEIESL